MNIVHVVNFMGSGGVEVFLKQLTNYQSMNNKIYIIAMCNKNTYNGNDFNKSNVVFISMKHEKIMSISNLINFRKTLKKLKPDLVHVHLFPAQLLVPIILFDFKCPIITTEHGISMRRKKYKWLYHIEGLSFRRYDRIIGVSDDVSNKLIEEYPKFRSKVCTVNNGIDIESIEKINGVSKTKICSYFFENDFIICMIGRLEVGKDYETLINAMKFLPNSIKLLIVGKGYNEEKLKKLIVELNLENRVYFFGFSKDILWIYKSIDLFVLSTEREGLPLVLLEAMASERVCLGSKVDGVKNILEDNDLLFEYGNFEELSKKIFDFYKDNGKMKKYSEYCFSLVKQYNINRMYDKYDKVYMEVISD